MKDVKVLKALRLLRCEGAKALRLLRCEDVKKLRL